MQFIQRLILCLALVLGTIPLNATPTHAAVASPQINVDMYGAVGNGIADDTSRIQAALDYINSVGGGKLVFPAKTYLITASLTIGSNTTLEGAGPKSIIKKGGAGAFRLLVNKGAPLLAGGGNVGILVQNLALVGDRPQVANPTRWSASTAYTVGQEVVSSSLDATTQSGKTYRCTVAGTTSSTEPSHTSGTATDGTVTWQYVGTIWRPGADAIFFSLIKDTHVKNVHMYNFHNDALIYEYGTASTVSDCVIYNTNKDGIYLSGCEHINVVNNVLHDIYTFAIAPACTWYSNISNNVSYGSTGFGGIGMGRDSRWNTVSNNTVQNIDCAGESITGSLHGKTYPGAYGDYKYAAYHNTISNNSVTGFIRLIGCDDNLVSNNVIKDAPFNGILLQGSKRNNVTGNVIYNGGSVSNPQAILAAQLTAADGVPPLQNPPILPDENIITNNSILDDRSGGAALRTGIHTAAGVGNVVAHNKIKLGGAGAPVTIVSGTGEAYENYTDATGKNTLTPVFSETVSIGTTNRGGLLHMYKAGATAVSVLESGTAGATDVMYQVKTPDRTWNIGQNVYGIGAGKFSIWDLNSTRSRFVIDTNGNVGIGQDNTAPANVLDVLGTFRATGAGLFGSTLGVTGATTLSSTLAVTGATTLTGATGIGGPLTVSSASNDSARVRISGPGSGSGTGFASQLELYRAGADHNWNMRMQTDNSLRFTKGTFGANTTDALTLDLNGDALFNGNVTTKAGPVFNVKAYGALGDSSTNDYTAVAAAIAAASVSTTPSAEVYFPAGTYVIASPLTIPVGVVLRGASGYGQGTWSQLKYTGAGVGDFLTFDGSGSVGGGKIQDLILSRGTASGGNAIKLYATSTASRPGEFVISNVLVSSYDGVQTWARGLHVDGTAANTVGNKGVRTIYAEKFRVADVSTAGESIYINQAAHVTFNHVQVDPGPTLGAAGIKTAGETTNLIMSSVICNGDMTLAGTLSNVKVIGYVAGDLNIGASVTGADCLVNGATLTIASGAKGSAQGYWTGAVSAPTSTFIVANANAYRIKLAAGSTAANTAPIKLTPGTLMTTPENGAMEFDASGNLHFTGSGTIRDRIFTGRSGAATLDFPSIAAGASADLTFTITGASNGNAVSPAWPPSLPAGIVGVMFVSATDTITVRLSNVSAAPIDYGLATFGATVLRL